MRKYCAFSLAVTMFTAPLAHADISVNFIESAPKDRFVIQNKSTCSFQKVVITIDLSSSAGKLVFDTTGSGAGVEVFQPFEVSEGALTLVSTDHVKDGDSRLSVGMDTFKPSDKASFTIDVDDTLPEGQLGMIRVAGAEIDGGLVTITMNDQPKQTGQFNTQGQAVIEVDC